MGIELKLLDRVMQRARCLLSTGGQVLERDPASQHGIDAVTAQLLLYEMPMCPYCCKVRRRVRSLGLDIVSRNVARDDAALAAMLAATDSSQVPCLYINEPGEEPRWLFESNDIVAYLEGRFGV